jgi:cytochrome b561
MNAVTRYHPMLVALHWGLAFLIGGALFFGALKMVHIPNASPQKVEALRAHMTAGLTILLLMGVRLLVRSLTAHPPAASAGNPWLDRLAWLSHGTFYSAVMLMAASGLFMAMQAGVIGVLVGAHPGIPHDFWAWPLRSVHYFLSRFLMALIALHLLAVLYHSVVLKDGLIRRMGFGLQAPVWWDRMPHFASWFSRVVLVLAAFILTMIGVKFIANPVGAAAASDMALQSPLAVTNMRASFGAFPLACAIFIVVCLLSSARRVAGLRFVIIVIGVVLLVRAFGIYQDGTLVESRTVLAAEFVLLILSGAGLALERLRRRQIQDVLHRESNSVNHPVSDVSPDLRRTGYAPRQL